jgi:hypothetical protein
MSVCSLVKAVHARVTSTPQRSQLVFLSFTGAAGWQE